MEGSVFFVRFEILKSVTMGNLLKAPILEKDTHVGRTLDQLSSSVQQRPHDEDACDDVLVVDGAVRSGGGGNRNGKKQSKSPSTSTQHSSPDGGGLHYGISSMQGWRIHMEDAHIAQPFLFAEEDCTVSSSASAQPSHDNNDKNNIKDNEEVDERKFNGIKISSNGFSSSSSSIHHHGKGEKHNFVLHPLHNHSLFAIFDGHGGKFAANYSSLNLLRILSRNSNFVQYARKWNGRVDYLENLKRECGRKRSNRRGGSKKKKEEEVVVDIQSGKTTSIPSRIADYADAESLVSSRGKQVTTSKGADNEDDEIENSIPEATTAAAAKTTNAMDNINDDNEKSDKVRADDVIDERHQRLRQLKKRGHECDERVRAIRDQVRRCFADEEEGEEADDEEDDDDISHEIAVKNIASNGGNDKHDKDDDSGGDDDYTDAYYRAEATYDRNLMLLLESSLCDAFLDLDAEILAEMRGDESRRAKDANIPFGADLLCKADTWVTCE